MATNLIKVSGTFLLLYTIAIAVDHPINSVEQESLTGGFSNKQCATVNCTNCVADTCTFNPSGSVGGYCSASGGTTACGNTPGMTIPTCIYSPGGSCTPPSGLPPVARQTPAR